MYKLFGYLSRNIGCILVCLFACGLHPFRNAFGIAPNAFDFVRVLQLYQANNVRDGNDDVAIQGNTQASLICVLKTCAKMYSLPDKLSNNGYTAARAYEYPKFYQITI